MILKEVLHAEIGNFIASQFYFLKVRVVINDLHQSFQTLVRNFIVVENQFLYLLVLLNFGDHLSNSIIRNALGLKVQNLCLIR